MALILVNPPAVKVMLVVLRVAVRPVVADMESVTVPVKPLKALTVIRAVPGSDGKKFKAASCHEVTSGPIEDREEVAVKR